MAEYTIQIMDAKGLGKSMPTSNTYKMSGYAESTVIQNAKDTARKVGATRFSIMKGDRLMGIWIFSFKSKRWSMMVGYKWW